MSVFGRLPVTVKAAAGVQTVTPNGWLLGGSALIPNPQTFAATITPDLTLGNWIQITATSGIAFAVQSPTIAGAALTATNILPYIGQVLLVSLINASGGALGAFSMVGVWRATSTGFSAGFATANQQSAFHSILSLTQIISVSSWSGPSAT